MNKIHLITIVLTILILTNCKKEEKETKINIEYELLDDVSPVKAKLLVNEDIGWSKWIINDTSFNTLNGEDFLEYVFWEDGISTIELNASGNKGEKYYGNLEINIPQIANKLIFYGYYTEDGYDFGFTEDTISFEFDYYNGTEHSYSKIFVQKDLLLNTDSVVFETPVIIDISGFDELIGEDLYINIRIEGESIFAYYSSSFHLKDWYYNHRLYAPNYIYPDADIGENGEKFYLIADWTRN